MAKSESREAVGTFGEAASSKEKLPKTAVTPKNSFKGGDLKAEQKGAADILGGNASKAR